MNNDEFSYYIEKAVVSLPEEFREKLDNVAIVVDESPSRTQYQQAGMKPGHGVLLGLYEGIPQTKRGVGYGIGGTLPDKITIFKDAILYLASTREEIIMLIHDTVLHEIAHHFGMDEAAVRRAEQSRRADKRKTHD